MSEENIPVGIPFAGPDPDYICKRRPEYPPMLDFIDAWVKQDEVALEEYRQACLAVKAKYPKPTE